MHSSSEEEHWNELHELDLLVIQQVIQHWFDKDGVILRLYTQVIQFKVTERS